MVGIAVLMIGAMAANAAVVVNLANGTGNDIAQTTFTYSNLNSTVTFDSGTMKTSATLAPGGTLAGASGSLAVTWTATTVMNALNWSFDTASAYEVRDFSTGWGISTLNDATPGAGNIQADETFLLKFDTSDLTLDSGQNLIFSISPNLAGTQFVVYERTGAASGATNLAFVSDAGQYSFNVMVGGSNEYAIAMASGTANLLTGFEIDVVGAITGTAKPTGLAGIPLDSGAILDWDSDITGFLDYYTVYRSTVSDTNTYVAITNVVSSEHLDSGLTNGTTYYYAVTAVGTNGTPIESEFSDPLAITPLAISTNTVLLMHYDASVPYGVVRTNASRDVSRWINQVAPGTHDASSSISGVLYPGAVFSATRRAGLDFTVNPTRLELMDAAESDLLLNQTGGKSGFVVLMALRPEGAGLQQDIIGNTSTVSEGFGIRWTGEGFQTWLAGSTTLNTTATNGDTVVVSFRYDVANREISAWESASGNTFTQTRNPADYSLAAALTLGQTTSTSRNFGGQIFEVKVWGSTLDDATLATEQRLMAAKWVDAYSAWAGQWGPDIGGDAEDFDSDGLDNLNEYGLGGNPVSGVKDLAVLPSLRAAGGELNYVHVQRNDDPSLSYTVETSTNLVTGSFTNRGYVIRGTNLASEGAFDTVTNLVPTTENELFIRLIVDKQIPEISVPPAIGGGADTEAPSIPANLRESGVTMASVTLAWDAATDNVGVTSYQLQRDSAEEYSVGNVTSYTLTGLSSNTSYNVKVKAYDAAGNDSGYSPEITVTTSAGTPIEEEPARLWSLFNPSFEIDSSGGWLKEGDNVGGRTLASSPPAYDGDYYLRILRTGGMLTQAIYQPIAGHRYEVSAWVYNHGKLEVDDIGSDNVYEISTHHGESWQKVTVTFVSTGSPALIHASYGEGDGRGYFDLFDVKDVTTDEDLARPVPENIMRYPSQVFDVSRWKITLPIDGAVEYLTPFLYTYSIDPWFMLVQDEDGYAVQFRANHGAESTSGSKNPRSEFREMFQNYAIRDSNSAEAWSNTDGKIHTMWIKQKVTHLTSVKPEVVLGQIHDENDDVVVFRMEGHERGIGVVNTHANLWLTDGDETHAYLVDDNYEIGTLFTVKIISHDGVTEFEYNEQPVDYVHREDIDGCYFKVGTYTQSNDETAPTESLDAYAENYVYDCIITHK